MGLVSLRQSIFTVGNDDIRVVNHNPVIKPSIIVQIAAKFGLLVVC